MIGSPELPQIIDTHAHLDEPVFDADRDAILAAARAAGVRRIINIGYAPSRWISSAKLREEHSQVEVALGVHPQLAAEFGARLRRDLERAVVETRPIAIGETGFDFSRSNPTRREQQTAFEAQIELAVETRLPIIIHQRNASDGLMEELDRWPNLAPIVLHSFDGTPRLASWAVERGSYVGVGGLATKPASAELRQLLKVIPTNRLLLETDSPYLAPPGAARRNTPGNLPLIADLLAPLWNLAGKELCALTTENAFRLWPLRERT